MTQDATAPRIYAACLASYNSGRLFGAWIDCEGKDGDAIRREIDDMLAKSPCPNVMRRKCAECGAYQTDSTPYRENSDFCGECCADFPLPAEFKPSAEEWAIHDFEGFAGLIKGEYPDLDEVAALAEVLAEDDDDKRRGLLFLVNDLGLSVSDAVAKCDEVRTFDSDKFDLAADYAEELAADCIEDFDNRAGQWPFNCIDWERAGRELLIGGDVSLYQQDGERFLVTNPGDF